MYISHKLSQNIHDSYRRNIPKHPVITYRTTRDRNYDPLFYDVMIYIFGTMMFTIFLLGIISFWLRVHGWAYKDNRERWVDELDRHFEREGIGLIPDNGKYW